AILRNARDRHGVARAAAMGSIFRDPFVAPGKAPSVIAASRAFPLRFGGQAQPVEPRERIRLVPTHADDRLIRREIGPPGFVVPEPRLLDAVLLAPLPALVRPCCALAIAILY